MGTKSNLIQDLSQRLSSGEEEQGGARISYHGVMSSHLTPSHYFSFYSERNLIKLSLFLGFLEEKKTLCYLWIKVNRDFSHCPRSRSAIPNV